MATEDIHVSVPFSPEQHEALKFVAKRDGRSKAGQVRHLCAPTLNRVVLTLPLPATKKKGARA